MKRAQMLRFHYKYIPSGSFAARRTMLVSKYLSSAKKKDPMAQMQQMQDPDMMGVSKDPPNKIADCRRETIVTHGFFYSRRT